MAPYPLVIVPPGRLHGVPWAPPPVRSGPRTMHDALRRGTTLASALADALAHAAGEPVQSATARTFIALGPA